MTSQEERKAEARKKLILPYFTHTGTGSQGMERLADVNFKNIGRESAINVRLMIRPESQINLSEVDKKEVKPSETIRMPGKWVGDIHPAYASFEVLIEFENIEGIKYKQLFRAYNSVHKMSEPIEIRLS